MSNINNIFKDGIPIPSEMPMLPVRDIVVFPYMILPLFVGRENSIRAVEQALAGDRIIFLSSQKEISDENPTPDRIYETGTIAMIMRMRKLPDGRIKILTQGLSKGRVKSYLDTDPFYRVNVERISDLEQEQDSEVEALMRSVKEQLEKVVSMGKVLSPDILLVVEDIKEAGKLADLITSNLGLKVEEAQKVLETLNPRERLFMVNQYLSKEIEVLMIQVKIKGLARDEMARSQKEYFLREQMKAIKTELGDLDQKNDEIEDIRKRILDADMPEEAEKEAVKQLGRLERMHPDASEAAVLRTYLDWIVELPWSKSTRDMLDLERAKKILDEDHYDLEEVKERILEHLAVGKLKQKIRGPILCFAGPPGVGKTSLGKSIAKALGREFIRISLGGVKDEAEIRGHRRTYVGSMPGKIIQGIKQASTNNPVFVLDEIDKLGADFKGDPSSALLEVLDPEQNFSFRDHYLNLSFDLSNVMFIATANFVDSIPPALKDRMEIIQLAGYTAEEKIKIARKYLIPKQINENGLSNNTIRIKEPILFKMIREYTREAGLRNFERLIGKICRKVAKIVAEDKRPPKSISANLMVKYLGPSKYIDESANRSDEVGICTGLAWTEFGGEVLQVEVASAKGTGLKLTGNLGEVMKESAMAALGYVKTMATFYGIKEDYFQNNEIHIHVPAGAVPKDGPSAGITIATAILSHLTARPVSKDIAMTGEISLLGKVLPIGGLKEKSLAAMRAGIKTVIAPALNEKDLVNIPAEYRNKLNFVFVDRVEDVIDIALLPRNTENIEYLDEARRKSIKAVA
ncbi:MAG: endopeptidase La [Oligoflexia bacterium]|nr:endopeptidase La [Oligoflexia bacterium]